MKYVLALFFVSLVYGQAGFKSVLSSNGANYLKDIGIELLEKAIETLSIPNIVGNTGTPVGKVDYWLEGITLTGFAIGSSSVGYTSNGISINIQGITCHVGLSWRYRKDKWPHISDHGTCDVSVSQVSAVVNVVLGASGGHPTISVASDGVNIGHLDIKLHGGASWLYQIFVNIFSHQIKDAVDKALTSAITKNVDNGLNKAFSTLPMEVKIGHEAVVDYALVSNPLFSSSFMQLPELGEFYTQVNPSECTPQYCPRYQIPDVMNSEQVQMIISDYVPNTAGYAFWKIGKLVGTITDKNIPSWSPVRLNTSSFKDILPELFSMYPNDAMLIRLSASQPPRATFSSAGSAVHIMGNIQAFAILANGTLAPCFTIAGFIQTSGQAMLQNEVLSVKLAYLVGNFTLAQSYIGDFDVALLNGPLNLLFTDGIVPAVNLILSAGFKLPTVQGLTFVSPTIGYGDHFLYVSTNIQYIPPMASDVSPISIQ